MSSYSWMKRLLAVVLAFSMTLGVVPANAVDALTAEAEPENSLGGIDALIQPAETFTAYESDLFVAEEEETVEVDPETVPEEELLPDEEEQEELELLDVEYAPLSGKVLDEKGNGLAGVTVAIFDFELNEVLAHVTTNGSGTWSFGEAQVGLSYQVSYYCPGYTMEPRTESFEAVSGAIQLEDVTASKRAVFDGVSTPESQFTYTIQDSYYATITGYTGSDSVVVIPEKLAEGTLTVRAIAGKMFYNRAALTAVSLPATVVSIGDSAFAGCSNLEFIDLPNTVSSIGNYAFQNCTKLTEIELPDSVSDLGQRVFAGCTALELVDYPAGLKSVDYWGSIFEDCTSLKTITVPEGVTFLPNNVFESAKHLEKVILPSTLTKIGEDAFKDCVKLQAPELPEGLATIGASAFSGNTAMKSIAFPKSLTTIGGSAFDKCTGLTEVSFQEGVTNLGSYAFQNCTGLTKLVLPDSITTLGQRVFAGCAYLRSINYPKSLTTVDYWGAVFEDCVRLRTVSVPEGVTVLPDNAFEAANYLRNIILPASLKTIGSEAFKECIRLRSVDIMEGLTTIRSSAFMGCTNLEGLYLPGTITAYGEDVFANCPSLVVECKEYSRAVIYCMKNGIPVKFIAGNLEDESNLFLDRDKTYYTANAAGALANGYVTVNLGYGFKEAAGAVSNIQLDILLPKGNTIMPDTLRLNGKLVTDDNNDNVSNGDILDSQNVKLTLGETEGELSFCLRPIAGTKLNSYAVLTYTMDGNVHEEIIGCINDVVSVLTIQASVEVSESTVTVTGAGPLDGQVDLYVDGIHAATAYTYKSGRYSATVTLPDPEDYKSYTLSARAVDADGTTATVQQTVRYVEGTPELTRFLVSYGDRIYNAMDPNQQHPLIVYEGTVWNEEWAKFGFEVSFDNNEAVDKVYICSTRNGVTKRLPATWNADKKAFTVRDMFEPGNPYYIPGTMTVEYTRPEPTLDFNQGVDFTSARYINAASEVIQNALNRKAEEYLTLSSNSEDLLKGTIALTDVDAMLDFDIATKMLPEYLNKLNAEQYGYQAMSDDMGYQLFIKVADVGEDHLRAEIVDFGKETVVDVLIDGGFGNAAASLDSAFAFADALGYADTLLTWDNNRVSLKEARQAILSSSMSPAEKAAALKKIEYAEKSNHGVVACMGLQILLAAAGVALPFPVSMVLPLIALQNSNFVDQILGGTGGDHDYMKGTSLLDAIMDAIFKIDPSGIVYDSETGEPIEGVTTTAYWISYEESGPDAKPSDDQYGTIWDAEPYEEENPLSTDNRGYYAWDVPEGWWRVKAEHPDYETVWSEWLPVAPPQTEVDLAMKRVTPRDLYEFTVESKEYNFISASVSTSVNENVPVIVMLAVYDSNDRLMGIASDSGALNKNQPLDVEVRLEEDAIPAYSKTFLLDSTTYAPLRSPWIKAW